LRKNFANFAVNGFVSIQTNTSETMDLDTIFTRLWQDYINQNPSAGNIYKLFSQEGETVVNDHIAFRTLDYPEINIDVLAKPFISHGYEPRGEYFFKDKHLYARHFELPGNENAPRIFISQLILSECSWYIQNTLKDAFSNTDKNKFSSEELIFSGSLFSPLSFDVYSHLREESEYAAWFYVFGFRANHFTVSINALKKFSSIVSVNELLKSNGYVLNSSGGEIKGTPLDLLQQSSTMADGVEVNFVEGKFEVPCCYYEFAQRYPDSSGKLYNGFVAKSADKIFESTNFYTRKH
jgi:hypothetical protein